MHRIKFMGAGVIVATTMCLALEAKAQVSTPPMVLRQTQAQIQAYWTKERMDTAIARPMPTPNAANAVAVLSPMAGLPANAIPGVMPGWNPNSGLPPPTEASKKLFLPGTPAYNKIMAQPQYAYGTGPSNPVDYANYGKFQRWNWYGNYAVYPHSTIGKMFFTQNGTNYVCSGTIWNRNSFVTAGHCVSTGAGGWSTNVLICPSYYDVSPGVGGQHPSIGCWASTGYMATSSAWHFNGNFDRDYACVVTAATGTIRADRVGNVTGWAGFGWNWPTNQLVIATGYPHAAPFNGIYIHVTAAPEWYTQDWGSDGTINNVSKYIGNDMTGGSSGGSWWLNISHRSKEIADVDGSDTTDPGGGSAVPWIIGVNSHKRCTTNCNSPPSSSAGVYWDEMGSPQFFESSSDSGDIVDIYNLCANNGGN